MAKKLKDKDVSDKEDLTQVAKELDDGKEKKKKTPQELKKESLFKLRTGINKAYEVDLMNNGDFVTSRVKLPRFSTGSFFLDYSLGGGVPKGKFIMLWGNESTMKSTIGYKVMFDAQRRDRVTNEYLDLKNLSENYTYDNESKMYLPNISGLNPIEPNVVAVMDLEDSYDVEWAKHLGLQTERIEYATAQYGEQAVDIVTEWIKSQMLDVILIDSATMIVPIGDLENSTEKHSMGKKAVLMNRAVSNWTMAMQEIQDPWKKPTVIFIQQEREKITMFGDPATISGGKGQKFITSIEVHTNTGKMTFLDDDKKYPLWKEMNGVVNKNKTAPAKITYSFDIAVNNYDPETSAKKVYPIAFNKGDILEHKNVMEFAAKLGFVGKIEEKGHDHNNEYFIKLSDKEIHYYEKKGDLINEWFYFDEMKYLKIKNLIVKKMMGE